MDKQREVVGEAEEATVSERVQLSKVDCIGRRAGQRTLCWTVVLEHNCNLIALRTTRGKLREAGLAKAAAAEAPSCDRGIERLRAVLVSRTSSRRRVFL